MVNNSANQEQTWKRCPEGVLHRVAANSAKRGKCKQHPDGSNQFDRRKMLQIAAAVAVTTGTGAVAYQSLFPRPGQGSSQSKSMGYGGISCGKFIANIKSYIDKGLDDQKLVASMDEHLKLCKRCQAAFKRLDA